jgi:hypothetical protein
MNFLCVNKKLKSIFLLLALLSSSSCGVNTLGTFSDRDTDAAKLEDAKKSINSNPSDYDTAIAKILAMSSEAQGTLEVKKILAGAYAGKCGLNFLSFVRGLTTPGAASIFAKLMIAMQSQTPDLPSCTQAENVILSLGSAANRPANVNFFFAIYGFSKIGLYLRAYADPDGSGTVEAPFDSCSSAQLPDEAINNTFTGLGIALENIGTVLSVISQSAFGTEVVNFQAQCEVLLGSGNCNITNTSLVTGPMRNFMRDILKSQLYGIENCANPIATLPLCC